MSRAEERAQVRQAAVARVVGRIITTVPELTEADAVAALGQAKAFAGKPFRELDEYLVAHPDALTSGDPHSPLSLVRLAYVLAEAGHDGVKPPTCSRCERATPKLPSVKPEGRVCGNCAANDHRDQCARCGQVKRMYARRPEGRICGNCLSKDPQATEPCSQCGKVRRAARRLPDGTGLCQTCAPKPLHTCVSCGRRARANTITEAGAICVRCYNQAHKGQCDRCGRSRRISQRAKDGKPALCDSCYRRPEGRCQGCGRTRPGGLRDGIFLCESCQPRPHATCARCHESAPVHARWPMGPVCDRCYLDVRDHPGQCARCGRTRALIGLDQAGALTCGTCSGATTDYLCQECGQPGRPYARGRCDRCVLTSRLRDLLANPDGVVSQQLQPVVEALSATDRPRTLIRWLLRAPAKLLSELAAKDQPLSHELLDDLPQTHALHYARRILVHASVLPTRNEYLERVEPWLEQLLADQPAHRAKLIDPYARWFVLHRARRSAATRGSYTERAGQWARTRIRVALDFLTWLDKRDIALGDVTQGHVDAWLDNGSRRAYAIRYFLTWTARHNLTRKLAVPIFPHEPPSEFLDDDHRWQLLRRCLTEEAMPLDVRVGGSLVLLFGLSVTRITHLTCGDIERRSNGRVWLRVGHKPLRLPPRLAAITLRLADGQRDPSAIASRIDSPRYLLPGHMPGYPLNQTGFGAKLARHGIPAHPGRNTALMALAAELPASVIADLFDLHLATAVRWTKGVGRDWTSYLAARAESSDEENDVPSTGSPCEGNTASQE